MLNKVQLEFLNSLIAEEGIYFEVIKDEQQFSLGTKILYLERALIQDCETFNQALDKLYDPNLTGEQHSANIEFIRALKVIHDLYFNHELKYGQYGTRTALVHYFSRLGDNNLNTGAFQSTIKHIIYNGINTLTQGQEQTVREQKQARQKVECNRAQQTGWRLLLDLPSAQRLPRLYCSHTLNEIVNSLNGAITRGQYQQLLPEQQHLVAQNIHSTLYLIQRCGATFEQLQILPVEQLQSLINYAEDVARLVNIEDVSFELLIQFYSPVCINLLQNSFNIERLVTNLQIPFQDLMHCNPILRAELFQYSESICYLVNTVKIAFSTLMQFNPERRKELFENPQSINRLVRTVGLSFDNLMTMEPTVRTLLIWYSYSVETLVNKLNLSVMDIVALDQAARVQVLQNSLTIKQLILQQRISFEQLVALPLEQLTTVVACGESEEAEEILNSISSSYRPVMI